jgi:phage baseplate assembly protein V
VSKEREFAHVLRGLITRAFVTATDDSGETQTANVRTHASVDRSGIEIMQAFGFASRPRSGGALVVFAIGGDQGDMVGMPVGLPEDRFGGLEEGESALYGADGTRVHVKANGRVHTVAKTGIVTEVEGSRFELDAESFRVEVAGQVLTLDASGLKHNGKNVGDTHVHGGITPGADDTDVPSN